MTLPPLPPCKYCIPTHMIFHSQLSPAVFHTWLQLHSLTWHGQQSFTFHLQDWVDLTGTSRITFLRHLDQLQKLHALRWHSLGGRQVHVSFAGVPYPSRAPRRPSARSSPQVASPKMGTPKLASLQPVDPNMGSTKMDISAMRNSLHSLTPQSASIPAFEPGALESSASADPADELVESIPDSRNLESPNPSSSTSSLNSQTSLNSGCKPKKEKIKYLGIELEGGGEREYEGEAGASQSGNLNAQHSSPPLRLLDPAELYASLLPHRLTPSQCHLLLLEVTDPALWQRTLQHWRTHHPHQPDLLALLRLYHLGDPSSCPTCHPPPEPMQ
jgi:hypothetical protein